MCATPLFGGLCFISKQPPTRGCWIMPKPSHAGSPSSPREVAATVFSEEDQVRINENRSYCIICYYKYPGEPIDCQLQIEVFVNQHHNLKYSFNLQRLFVIIVGHGGNNLIESKWRKPFTIEATPLKYSRQNRSSQVHIFLNATIWLASTDFIKRAQPFHVWTYLTLWFSFEIQRNTWNWQ